MIDIEKYKRLYVGRNWKAERKRAKRFRMSQNPNSKAARAVNDIFLRAGIKLPEDL